MSFILVIYFVLCSALSFAQENSTSEALISESSVNQTTQSDEKADLTTIQATQQELNGMDESSSSSSPPSPSTDSSSSSSTLQPNNSASTIEPDATSTSSKIKDSLAKGLQSASKGFGDLASKARNAFTTAAERVKNFFSKSSNKQSEQQMESNTTTQVP